MDVSWKNSFHAEFDMRHQDALGSALTETRHSLRTLRTVHSCSRGVRWYRFYQCAFLELLSTFIPPISFTLSLDNTALFRLRSRAAFCGQDRLGDGISVPTRPTPAHLQSYTSARVRRHFQ